MKFQIGLSRSPEMPIRNQIQSKKKLIISYNATDLRKMLAHGKGFTAEIRITNKSIALKIR